MNSIEIAEKIIALDNFDMYDAYDNSECGTLDDVKRELANSIETVPEDVMQYLSDIINDIDNGVAIGDDNADDVMEIINSIKEYCSIED